VDITTRLRGLEIWLLTKKLSLHISSAIAPILKEAGYTGEYRFTVERTGIGDPLGWPYALFSDKPIIEALYHLAHGGASIEMPYNLNDESCGEGFY
jgi:hypothetical protein